MAGTRPGSKGIESRLADARVEQDDVEAKQLLAGLRQSLLGRSDDPVAVDRYRILERVGQGAQGVVYSAYDAQLDRKIAIKLVRPEGSGSQGTTDARSRVVREARALAKLSHPNVLQIFDVGRHDDQIFLATELIDGQPLDEWMWEDGRGRWRAVLDVYVAAGRGLAAAHAAGIVHRDFKPANVMIDRGGRVRVMDFGLAAPVVYAREPTGSTDSHTHESSGPRLTTTGVVMGTPAYMPPEQHMGQGTDERGDQYAFCVALWEGLHGARPFAGKGIKEIALAKLNDELVDVPDDVQVPARIRKILARGLAVAPNARWPSMNQLLEALQPRRSRTRWLMLGAAAVGVAALVPWLGAAPGEPVDACGGADERLSAVWNDAEREGARAGLVATELSYAAATWDKVDGLLDDYANRWTRTYTDGCKAVRDEPALVDKTMACLNEQLEGMAALMDAFANANRKVVERAVNAASGLPKPARCRDRSYLLSDVPLPSDETMAAEVEAVRRSLARCRAQRSAGRYQIAWDGAEAAMTEADRLGYRPLQAEAANVMGNLTELRGRYEQARVMFEQAYFAATETGHDQAALFAATQLIFVLGMDQADYDAAWTWVRHARSASERVSGGTADADLFNAIGALHYEQGRYDDAIESFTGALEAWQKLLGPDHPNVAGAHHNLSIMLNEKGESQRALEEAQKGLALRTRMLGADHPFVAQSSEAVANALERLGRFEESLISHRKALAIRERALGPNHPLVALSVDNIGISLEKQGLGAEIVELHERALAIRERAMGDEHPMIAMSLDGIGTGLRSRGQVDRALVFHRRALAMREQLLGPEHPDVASTLTNIGLALEHQGDRQALLYYRRAHATLEETLGADHPSVADLEGHIARVEL